MKTLQFEAIGQSLRRLDRTRIAKGTKGGYLRCAFALDDEWDGQAIAVSFNGRDGIEHAAMLEDDGTCAVPDEVTDSRMWRVALVGMKDDEKMTTNGVYVRQVMR